MIGAKTSIRRCSRHFSLHMSQCASRLKPSDLSGVECVIEKNFLSGTVFMLDDGLKWHSLREVLESDDGDSVGGLNLIVVGGVGKGEGKETLLLQVGLVDSREALDDDGAAAEMTWLQRSVLAG